MNQSGQAFSTFKLLIAAVVAIVILTILMQIIGIIPGIGTSDPPKAAADLLQEVSGKYAYEKPSSNIEFKLNDSINAKGIAKSTKGAVQEEEVCIYAGDFKDDTERWESNESTGVANQVTYVGTTPQKARLVAMCDAGKEILDTISTYGKAIDATWVDVTNCPCASTDPSNTGVCCILAVKKPV